MECNLTYAEDAGSHSSGESTAGGSGSVRPHLVPDLRTRSAGSLTCTFRRQCCMTEALASPVPETSYDEVRPFLRVQAQFSDSAGRLLAHAGRECTLLRPHTFAAGFTKAGIKGKSCSYSTL